jgi:uncharacterized protein
MKAQVEWDARKALINRRKHGVTFEEAASVFHDFFSVTIADPDHSDSEDRFIIIGWSIRQRVLVVVHTDRGNAIRMISARVANTIERRTYEER